MGKIFPWMRIFFPMRLITCNKNYRFLRFLVVFHTSGLMVNFQNYEPGKNVKICNFTDIVPAAARSSNQKRPCWKEKIVGAFWWKKFYEARIFEVLQPDGCGRYDVLFVKSILDHVFENVYWRNHQSYFRYNSNYFPYFQKIIQKKL